MGSEVELESVGHPILGSTEAGWEWEGGSSTVAVWKGACKRRVGAKRRAAELD